MNDQGRARGAWTGRTMGAAAGVSLALAGWFPGNNSDTFGHLAQGRQIAELGTVPRIDTWSLLPGPARPWYNYEWLSDLGTWLLYAHYSYVAVTLFKCALLVIAALCLSELARLLAGVRGSALASLVMIGSIPAVRVRLSDRPHVLGLCLAAAYLLLLTVLARAETQRRRVAIVASLTALHLVWVNAHGSHLLGLFIGLSFLALGPATLRRWYAGVVCLQVVASCLSPYGPMITFDAIAHVADARYRHLVSEWQPWQPHDPVWMQIGPALHAALLALVSRSLAPLGQRHLLALALALAVMCFRSIRFLAEFLLLTSPLLGAGFAMMSRHIGLKSFALIGGVLTSMAAVGVPLAAANLPPGAVFGARLSYEGTPRAGAAALSRLGRSPRVFASMQDSWFTMFAAPHSRFVVDGRVPLYGPDHVLRVSQAFANRARFDALIHEFDVNAVIARHAEAGEQQLFGFMTARPGWSLIMIEDLHATYVRNDLLGPHSPKALPPLRALQPSYSLDWLLDADSIQRDRIREELARIAALEGTSAYQGWVHGALTLAPLRRGSASDGFRWPRDGAEWASYRAGYEAISRAAENAGDVPVVAALYASLAAVFCDFDVAEEALQKALAGGPSREPLLAAQELALRRGRIADVRQVVDKARALPQGRRDPWLAELASGLTRPPSCPGP